MSISVRYLAVLVVVLAGAGARVAAESGDPPDVLAGVDEVGLVGRHRFANGRRH